MLRTQIDNEISLRSRRDNIGMTHCVYPIKTFLDKYKKTSGHPRRHTSECAFSEAKESRRSVANNYAL